MPAAGSLRERITLAEVTRGRDSMGGVIETGDLGVEIWAGVETIGAKEYFDRSFTVRPELRVIIRFRENVRHRARVTWRERTYEVVSVRDPDRRRTRLELLCVAAKPGANA